MNMHVELAGFHFENPILNASGVHCFDRQELDTLRHSQAGGFTTKSATLLARQGNPLPRYADIPLGSLNSMGLPNLGIDYYLDYLNTLPPHTKPPILSVTGLSQTELDQLFNKIRHSAYQGLIELNLSCPNVVGKPQIGYDFESVERILDQAFSHINQPLGVKLPPYFDMSHFDQMATILNRYPLCFINSINSIGNGLYIEDECVVIRPKNGFGGLGGAYIKPTALANVHAFYQRLDPRIAIIGTGGVSSGRDVFEHILCGASLVQVGTALQQQGTAIFARLLAELEAIMQSKGYHNLADFRGKLRYLDA